MKRNKKTADMKQAKTIRVALVIGHKEKSQGARNEESGVSEFLYNEQILSLVDAKMIGSGILVDIVYRGEMSRLPDQINNLRPNWVVSLHCNAFNTKAGGTEVLYHHKSKKGKWLAIQFQEALLECFHLKDRGIKPKTSEDRGGYLLKYTNAPCVILEPFFIDNDIEYELGMENMEKYANTIVSVLRSLPDSKV